jgi:hypothetical protein
MNRALVSAVVLSSVTSFAGAYPTDLVAGDKSGRDGGVSVGSGGASISAGGVSVSAGRDGASASAGQDGARGSAGADGATASAGRGGASVSGGGTSVSANRGGASVSGGGTSVSANRGGASVSGGRGSVSTDWDGASARADRGNIDASGGRARALPADRAPADRSYKSYGSIGEWFGDLRTSWFGGRSERTDEAATARASATQRTETSRSGGTQVNRVVQEKSATATATDGGSAVAEASNVNVTEQKN